MLNNSNPYSVSHVNIILMRHQVVDGKREHVTMFKVVCSWWMYCCV